MSDWLTQLTSLPNLHPAVVHFPLALLPAALLFDLGGIVRRGARWLGDAAALLYVGAAAGAVAAYRAGRSAEDGLGLLPAAVQPELAEHADAAWRALWAILAVALARGVLAWRERRAAAPGRRAPGVAVLLLGVGALALLVEAADHGGALVYRHGVAVAVPATPALTTPEEGAEAKAPPPAGLLRGVDGSLSWRPGPADAAALAEVLVPAAGSPEDAITVVPGPGPGLGLAVRAPTLAVLPEPCGDVQLEVEVDLADWSGTVGLAHHVQSVESAGVFRVARDGRVALLERRDGRERVLDERTVALPEGPARLVLSVAGRHLKGLVGEDTVVHGHAEPLPGKACGLLFEGQGVVRLHALRATPLPLGAGH